MAKDAGTLDWLKEFHQKGHSLTACSQPPDEASESFSKLLLLFNSIKNLDNLGNEVMILTAIRLKDIGKRCNSFYAFDSASSFFRKGVEMSKAFDWEKIDSNSDIRIKDTVLKEFYMDSKQVLTFSPQKEAVELLHCFTHSAIFTTDLEDVYKFATDMSDCFSRNDSVRTSSTTSALLVDVFSTLGIALIEDPSQDLSMSVNALQKAVELSKKLVASDGDIDRASKIARAKAQCHLGYCYLVDKESEALECLICANKLWKELEWPIEESDSVLKSMTYCVEAELELSSDRNCSGISKDMIEFQKKCRDMRVGNFQVADAFDYLGRKAQNLGNLQRAEQFHKESLNIHRAAVVPSPTNRVMEQVQRLADCQEKQRNYSQAIMTYSSSMEFLSEQNKDDWIYLGEINLKMAWLHLHLQQFKDLEKCHNKALQYHTYNSLEDKQTRESLQMRLASWYFVQEKKREGGDMGGQMPQSGDEAFRKANDWTLHGLSCIYYACHLFCDEKTRSKSMQLIGKWSHDCTRSRHLLYFDKTHMPILTDDLKQELDNEESLFLPSVMASRYFTFLGYFKERNQSSDQVLTAFTELEEAVDTRIYYEGFQMGPDYGPKKLKSTCLSLVGYGHMHLNRYLEARTYFERASKLIPDYKAAENNITRCNNKLEQLKSDSGRY